MTTVVLRDYKQLAGAVRKLSRAVERQTVRGLRKAARFGVREVVRTALTTKPRPHARGTYLRSWRSLHVDGGAVVTNTSDHALYVEAGRRAGRQPPKQAILDWMQARGLDKQAEARMGPAGARAMAFAIARKIARKGIRGRWVLRRSLPAIDVEARRQINAAIRRAIMAQR